MFTTETAYMFAGTDVKAIKHWLVNLCLQVIDHIFTYYFFSGDCLRGEIY